MTIRATGIEGKRIARSPCSISRRRLGRLLAGAVLMAAATGSGAQQEAPVQARDAWIREAPPGAPMAGYLVLRNEGGAPLVLVGAESPAFAKVMLHRSREEGGMVRMVHVERLELAPGLSVTFAPGGYHLMLMRPRRALKAGDRVPITLRFAGGARRDVEFEVRRVR